MLLNDALDYQATASCIEVFREFDSVSVDEYLAHYDCDLHQLWEETQPARKEHSKQHRASVEAASLAATSAAAIAELAAEAKEAKAETTAPAGAAPGGEQKPPADAADAAGAASAPTHVARGAQRQTRNDAVGKVDSLLNAAAHGGFMSAGDLAAARSGTAAPDYIGDPAPPAPPAAAEEKTDTAGTTGANKDGLADSLPQPSPPAAPPPPPSALHPDDERFEVEDHPPPPSAPDADDVDTPSPLSPPPPPPPPPANDGSSTLSRSEGDTELDEFAFLQENGFLPPPHLRCDAGHQLQYVSRVEYRWYCDRCHTHFDKGSPVVTCPHVGECEYDICEDCCREACVVQHGHDGPMPYVVGPRVLPLTSGDAFKQHPWRALAVVGDAPEFHSEKEVSM